MSPSPTIVLTTDETMMSQYRGGIGTGFMTCMPSGILPDWLFFPIFAPPVKRREGRAVYSDFGLRMVEASLLRDGFTRDEVAVVHPRDLGRVIGPETRICGIAGHDFLGINPPTSTFSDFTRRGPPLNRKKFYELLEDKSLEGVKVVVGGKASWQVADPAIMDKLGIDYVHLGEGEVSVPRMFRSILNGEEVPRIVRGEDVPVESIPNLQGGTICGLVEISRGCGRGCSFCTPAMQKVRHKPFEQIEADIRTVLASGYDQIILHSEDVLRYGTMRIESNEEAVLELVRRTISVPGVKSIGFSHLALASAYHHPKMLERVSELSMSMPGMKFMGAQTGLETGSARLMRMHMHGKTLPSPAESWRQLVVQSLGLLKDNHWILSATLVIGLPGEQEEDVLQTIEMMDDIRDSTTFIVPMCFVSMKGARLSEAESFTVEKMTPSHWVLFGKCIQHDSALGRRLKKEILPSNPVTRAIGGAFLGRLLRGADKYAKVMLQGLPPREYSKDEPNYRDPKL